MKIGILPCLALVVSALPVAAFADDPRDVSMRNPAALARDRSATRQLNLKELARVRERDARDAQGWRAARAAHGDANAEYAARTQYHQRAMADYARDRARYEQDMAQWRRAVAACRAGDYSACDE